MNKEIALVIDTNSRYGDVWDACFGRLEKHFPKTIKKYVFTDSVDYEFQENYQQINYDDTDSYRNQFLSCIKQVAEPYFLYTRLYIIRRCKFRKNRFICRNLKKRSCF